MNLTYNIKSEIAGTIQLDKVPRGLGIVTDIHGDRWDIHGIIGEYVQACKENELHSYFTNTSGFNNYGLVEQTWKPYLIEIVELETEK